MEGLVKISEERFNYVIPRIADENGKELLKDMQMGLRHEGFRKYNRIKGF